MSPKPNKQASGKKTVRVLVAIGTCYRGNTEAASIFSASVTKAAAAASAMLTEEGVHLEVELVAQQTSQSKITARNVVSALNASSLLILDISAGDSAVELYQAGYCEAAKIPHIITIRRERVESIRNTDFYDDPLYYEDDANLSVTLPYRLVEKVHEVLAGQRISPMDRNLIWFPQETGAIHIVASKSTDNLYSSNPNHRNHVYLEQFSDKDTVLELMVFLSRNYSSRVHKYTSDEFPGKQLLRDNLVVIGGPGIDDVLPGNPICREFNRTIRSAIKYAEDGESLNLESGDSIQVIRPEYHDGLLLIDYGYFARFPNPFDPSASVIMVHGLHTSGVLGAALAFSDLPQAAENFRTVRGKFAGFSRNVVSFEALFQVKRVAGNVQVPKINEEWVFPLQTNAF
ncbi:MAG: hypothetical protein HQL63_08960 [Magnetococcales bacterium]|nr:hypothetical protein [Magnetococcales bacterium]